MPDTTSPTSEHSQGLLTFLDTTFAQARECILDGQGWWQAIRQASWSCFLHSMVIFQLPINISAIFLPLLDPHKVKGAGPLGTVLGRGPLDMMLMSLLSVESGKL
jgi:hypothetical protein